ncbi:hypothetical protein [uncultured Eubacterium sp.]|uniref:hypothetical protein n=1 Tax=uncultured Eubacterium sp. TaxID=165185 RepID=UPI0015BFD17E|nr:hypothetical protein [uncultured Eubacterium sp.]
MKKFETPEIKVVIFKTNDVISTSVPGYEGNVGEGDLDSYFSAGSSASQPLTEMPF